MKKLFTTVVVSCLASITFAQSTASNNTVPETMSNVFFKALQDEDTGMMTKILTSDFLITNVDGQSADKDLMGQALSGGQLVIETAATSNRQSRLVNSNTGIVSGKIKFKGSLQGQNFDTVAVFTLVAVKQGEDWKVSDVRLIGN